MHDLKKDLFTNNLADIDRGIFLIHHLDVVWCERIILGRKSPCDRFYRIIREKIHFMCHSFEYYFRSELENEKLNPFVNGDESNLQSEVPENADVFVIPIIDRPIKGEFLVITSIARE
jgi:hypothetical protein